MEKMTVNTSAAKDEAGAATPRNTLAPAHWIEKAIDVLASEGIAGLRVEVLAKRCKVTKGSFYWHFKDRQALLDAILERWKEGRIRDIEKTTAALPGDELAQLNYVIEVYGASRNRKGMAIELAVRDWARHDARAAATVEAVDLYRLECTRKLFVATGLSDDDAKSRSLLLYACVFGLSMMRYAAFADNPDELKRRIAEHIVAR